MDLGIFSIGSFNAGDDIELSVDVTVTDEDGDTADGTIDVTIDQDGSAVTLDLDNIAKAKLVPDYEKILASHKTK